MRSMIASLVLYNMDNLKAVETNYIVMHRYLNQSLDRERSGILVYKGTANGLKEATEMYSAYLSAGHEWVRLYKEKRFKDGSMKIECLYWDND